MHVCPAHFAAVATPDVWADDVALILLPNLTFKRAAVTAPVGEEQGSRIEGWQVTAGGICLASTP